MDRPIALGVRPSPTREETISESEAETHHSLPVLLILVAAAPRRLMETTATRIPVDTSGGVCTYP